MPSAPCLPFFARSDAPSPASGSGMVAWRFMQRHPVVLIAALASDGAWGCKRAQSSHSISDGARVPRCACPRPEIPAQPIENAQNRLGRSMRAKRLRKSAARGCGIRAAPERRILASRRGSPTNNCARPEFPAQPLEKAQNGLGDTGESPSATQRIGVAALGWAPERRVLASRGGRRTRVAPVPNFRRQILERFEMDSSKPRDSVDRTKPRNCRFPGWYRLEKAQKHRCRSLNGTMRREWGGIA